jgi:hypothetical protein
MPTGLRGISGDRGMLWTDDYLAAFAQVSDAVLTTLDRKLSARYPSVQVELLLP